MINIAIKLATSITYTADGSQTNFSVPFDYLRPSFVHVAVNDAEVSEGFTISNRMVMFDAAPAKDAVVRIYRNTPTTRLVSWADASILKAIDMTIAEVQQLHILEEASDWSKTNSIVLDEESGAWQGRKCRVSNVADPKDAQDVVTKNYLENTEDSFVQRMNAIKTQTEQFANTAGNSKDSAYKSAQSASTSAASAAESAELTSGYKQEALTAKNAAATSATNAKASEANAKTSENNAEASKEAAQSAASNANNFATSASSSASEAKSYRDAANNYAENAKEYAATATTKASETIAKVIEATDEANRAKAEADRAKSISDNIGNPVSDVTENNGTVTVTKSNGTQSTFMAFPQDANGTLPIAKGGTGATSAISALSNLGILDAIVNASVSGTTITFTKKDNTKITIDTQDTNNGIVASLLEQNGYIKFANGLILQWGVYTSGTRNVTITLPIATSVTYAVIAVARTANNYGCSGSQNCQYVSNVTNKTFQAGSYDAGNGYAGFWWIAISKA